MNRGLYALTSTFTRRQSTDVFYNDPFKIQSYNFRYADRPAYPVQHYQRPQPPPPKPPTFETYYQNPRFMTKRQDVTTSPFAEHRRRRYLQDFKCLSTPATKAHEPVVQSVDRHRTAAQSPRSPAPNPLLRTCCHRDEYQTMRRDQSVSTFGSTKTTHRGGRSASVSSLKPPERNCSTSTFKLSPRRSASSSSGCAININISALETPSKLDNNLRIQIETDSACLHNNTDSFKVRQAQPKSPRLRSPSSEVFVIDKRLSKFSLPEARNPIDWSYKSSCERDILRAKRLQVQSERQRVEQLRQQELQKEQQRQRQREQERERLRQVERRQDCDQLAERQRLRELERESQRKRDYERVCRYQERERQQRLPMRAMSMPTPVLMTSHLSRPTASAERLPGMAPCYVRPPSSGRERNVSSVKPLRSQQQVPVQVPVQERQREQEQVQLPPCRSSSGSSNYNARVPGHGSSCSLRRPLSTTHLNERKLLNLHVNGMPVSSHQPIHTRINNMPIRITTSQSPHEDLQFSLNKVRVRNASPVATRPAEQRRRSCSCSGASRRSEESYNVNINVYADNLRQMRL